MVIRLKKISFFCIPAHGHTNPMLPVAAELVRRGNAVRFYSFEEFGEKIRAAGAEFISCDSFLPELTKQEEAGLKRVSAVEMTVQDIRVTLAMSDFLDKEFQAFRPDVVYTDSVCFWGKLNAWKHHVPMVLYPQTGEQHAAARRVTEIGAGIMLKDDSSEGIRASVREILKHKAYGNAAAKCSKDFRDCSGAAGAAKFIENAPHSPVK